jgi:hypothetical protein
MLNVFYQIVDREGRKEFPESKLISFARGRADLRTATRLGIRPRCDLAGRCAVDATGVR